MSSKLIALACLAAGSAMAAGGFLIIREKDEEHPNPRGVLAATGGIGLLVVGLILAIILAPMFFFAS